MSSEIIEKDANEKTAEMSRIIHNREAGQRKTNEPKIVRVLVAEDDLALQPFWEGILNSIDQKFEMDWVTTKDEAERLIRHHFRKEKAYDLVISDVLLEGEETGIDLWNQMGEAAKNFVLVSRKPFEQKEVTKTLSFGNPICLEKPLSAERCRNLVRSLVA